MPVTTVERDPDTLTMTIVADFDVPVRRLWDAYADPRQLEKFWGPPEYPATFTRHDLRPGGRSHFVMTGPEGDTSAGYWEFQAVEEGRSFAVIDGFADEDHRPSAEMPTMWMTFTFEETSSGSRLTTVTTFGSLEELEQLLQMGMEEGTAAAMGQIDAVLADLQSFAAGGTTEVDILSDTQVRFSRIIRGSVEQVWRAHHEQDLLRRWLLGPDGWVMTGATVGRSAGEIYRYAWAPGDGLEGQPFALSGQILESSEPHREVTTETMEGNDGPPTVNEQTLTAVDGGTLLSLVITYADAETRDAVLATGMAEGMETSYARLESEVLAP